MKRTSLTIAALFFTGLVTAQDVDGPLTIKGLQPGMTKAEVNEQFGEPVYCNSRGGCNYRDLTFGGQPVSANVWFSGDSVTEINVRNLSDVQAIRIALMNKYGVWSGKNNTITQWNRNGSRLYLDESASSITLDNPRLSAEAANARGEAAASDL